MTEPLITENTYKEKFLLFFEPKKVINQACCCCTLKNGVKCLSVFFLFASGSAFIDSIKATSYLLVLVSIIYSVLYIVSAFYLFISAVNLNEIYAKVAYTCYEFIILIETTLAILSMILILIGIYQPFDNKTGIILSFFAFLISFTVILSIDLYFLWVIFSFRIMIMKGDYNALLGDDISKVISPETSNNVLLPQGINENINVANLP